MALTKVIGAGLGTVTSADLDGAVTINESSADKDFRVESDANTHALFLEGSTGNVGIGTSSINGKLNLATGAGTACELRLTSNNTGSGSGDRGRIAVHSARNDGTAYEAGKIEIDRSSGTEDKAHMIFATNDGSGNTERMRIKSNGNLGIGDGVTDPNFKLQVRSDNTGSEGVTDLRSNSSSFTGNILLVGSNTSTTNSTYNHMRADAHGVSQRFAIRDSGNVVNANNQYGSLSDERLKENIVDANSQWNDIKALKIRRYNRIGEKQKEIGVIAQELEASNMSGLVEDGPYYDVINNPDEETRKTVKYSILYMKAVKALQEAMTRIETLETENTTQATQIADLISRVTALESA